VRYLIYVPFFFFLTRDSVGLARRTVQAKKSNCALDTLTLLFCVVATITLLVFYFTFASHSAMHIALRNQSSNTGLVQTCRSRPRSATKPGLPGRKVSLSMIPYLGEDGRVKMAHVIQMFIQMTPFKGHAPVIVWRHLPPCYAFSYAKAGHLGQNLRRTTECRRASREKR
jgi:hypothetical protein